jgi:hypothetical protein
MSTADVITAEHVEKAEAIPKKNVIHTITPEELETAKSMAKEINEKLNGYTDWPFVQFYPFSEHNTWAMQEASELLDGTKYRTSLHVSSKGLFMEIKLIQ